MSRTGEVIIDQEEQLQRWVEHYLELYATQNIVTDTAMDAVPDLPVMEELDIPPTLEELSKAIDCLACGKAPGSDGIPPEALKMANRRCFSPCTNSFAYAGIRVTSPRICVMLTLSLCTKTKEIAAIATTIGAFPSSILLARHSPVSSCCACRF